MARVNVEQKAFTDDRFVRLGKAIGGDRWAAIGRMTLVWDACQERENHTLSRESIDAIHADIPNLTDLLIACELARQTSRGIYIRGAKQRTGWLGKARKNGKLGGRPRKNHTVTKEKPSGSGQKNPPALALTPALAPTGIRSKKKTTTTSAREELPSLPQWLHYVDLKRKFEARNGVEEIAAADPELYKTEFTQFVGLTPKAFTKFERLMESARTK